MGSFTRLSGGLAAITLAGAALAAAVPAAQAAPVAVQSTGVPCSTGALISAIQTANLAGSGVLELSRNCTYTLFGQATPGEGLPEIRGNITLSGGTGTVIRRASGTGFYRILQVDNHASLTVDGITLSNGNSLIAGGAIRNDGNLVVKNSFITGNSAPNGGAVANDPGDTASISDTTLNQNSTFVVGGGAIINLGFLTLNRDVISDNSAPFNGGGINNQPTGRATVLQTTITRNTAGLSGGGVSNLGRISFFGSQIRSNSARVTGGGIAASNGNNVSLTSTIVRDNNPNNCNVFISGCVG